MATFNHVSCYASPHLQENQFFSFNKIIYQVDRRIIKAASQIFHHLILKRNSNEEYRELPQLSTPQLSQKLLNYVLFFFRFGKLKEEPTHDIKDLQAISQSYNLPLLENYLKAFNESNTHLDVEKKLSLKDQLELAALQQNPEKFCALIEQINRDEPLSKEIFSTVVHFQPTFFEILLVNFIHPTFPHLFQDFIQMYFRDKQECIENVLHILKDDKLKFNIMAKIPDLNKRLKWFEVFGEKMPVDLIEKAVIQPLIEQGRLSEAKKWFLKDKECDSDLSLFKIFKEGLREEGLEKHFSLLVSKEVSKVPADPKENFCENFSHLSLDSSSSLSCKQFYFLDAIQEAIKTHLSIIQKNGFLTNDSKNLFEYINALVPSHFNINWNQELLLIVIRYYIQAVIQNYNQEVLADIKRINVPVRPHERHLHPALQENYELLCRLLPFLKGTLNKEFNFSNYFKLLDENQSVLGTQGLFSEILAMARDLYCQAFSLQEDFIIQFVSYELYPYINGQRNSSSSQPSESLLNRLETSFKEAGLGKELSPSHIELALFIYIQKGVEAVNFRHCAIQCGKLNIYNSPEADGSDAKALLKIIPALQTALKKDFPLEKVKVVAPQLVKFIEDKPQLIREVFIKAEQAYYRIFSPQPVEYKPYRPNRNKEESRGKELKTSY